MESSQGLVKAIANYWLSLHHEDMSVKAGKVLETAIKSNPNGFCKIGNEALEAPPINALKR